MSKSVGELYVAATASMLSVLYEVAKSGLVAPVEFAGAMRQIPGYDPAKASGVENQWFGGDGFPCDNPPKE